MISHVKRRTSQVPFKFLRILDFHVVSRFCIHKDIQQTVPLPDKWKAGAD
jgi:hypothetical protein